MPSNSSVSLYGHSVAAQVRRYVVLKDICLLFGASESKLGVDVDVVPTVIVRVGIEDPKRVEYLRDPGWHCGAAHGALAMRTPGDTSMASMDEVFKLMKGGTRAFRASAA